MTINDVKRINKEKGHHFFSKDTMAFFKSRIVSSLLYDAYFLTSEENPEGELRYTVRRFDPETGQVETMGKFHEIKTKREALIKLKQCALSGGIHQ